MKLPFKLLVLAVLIQVSACVFSDPAESREKGDPGSTNRYSIRDGNIVIAPNTYTRVFCGLTGELTFVETTNPEFLIPFELRGNTMKLFSGQVISVPSGLKVQFVNVLTREGYGPGIEGLWRFTGQEFRVQSGIPTAEENAYFADLVSTEVPYTRYHHFHWFIRRNTMTQYVISESALYFQALWNGAETVPPAVVDSAIYDIALAIADKHTVELRGARSGETVRISIGDDGSRDYSSNSPSHLAYHYETIPKTCPNDVTPEWYEAFLEANRKP